MAEMAEADGNTEYFDADKSISPWRGLGRAVNALATSLLKIKPEESDKKNTLQLQKCQGQVMMDMIGAIRLEGKGKGWREKFVREWARIMAYSKTLLPDIDARKEQYDGGLAFLGIK